MDGSQFDRLVRGLAAAGSRRSLLKRMLGGIVGGAGLVAVADGVDAATCRKPAEICRKDGDCCSGECGPVDRTGRRSCRCATASDCPHSSQCKSAVCNSGICGQVSSCGIGESCCPADGCVNLQTDPQNCGTCGNVVETDRAHACCGGAPTQLGTDANCSVCGDQCTGGEHCFPTEQGFQCRNPEICTVPVVTETTSVSLSSFTVVQSSLTVISTSLTSVVPISSSLTTVTPVLNTSLTTIVSSTPELVVSSACDVFETSLTSLTFGCSVTSLTQFVLSSISEPFVVTSSLTTVTPISSSLTTITPTFSSLTYYTTVTSSLTSIETGLTTITSSLTC